jgi:hypothetical protein
MHGLPSFTKKRLNMYGQNILLQSLVNPGSNGNVVPKEQVKSYTNNAQDMIATGDIKGLENLKPYGLPKNLWIRDITIDSMRVLMNNHRGEFDLTSDLLKSLKQTILRSKDSHKELLDIAGLKIIDLIPEIIEVDRDDLLLSEYYRITTPLFDPDTNIATNQSIEGINIDILSRIISFDSVNCFKKIYESIEWKDALFLSTNKLYLNNPSVVENKGFGSIDIMRKALKMHNHKILDFLLQKGHRLNESDTQTLYQIQSKLLFRIVLRHNVSIKPENLNRLNVSLLRVFVEEFNVDCSKYMGNISSASMQYKYLQRMYEHGYIPDSSGTLIQKIHKKGLKFPPILR